MDVAWAHSLSRYAVLHCPETPAEHGHWEQLPEDVESIEIASVTFPRPSWAQHDLVRDNRFVRLPILPQAFWPTNLTVQRSDGEVAQVWARSITDPSLIENWRDGIRV
ncbi:MAG: hypothetical protein ACR2PK_00635 [Acidimicrobiales bacterium]